MKDFFLFFILLALSCREMQADEPRCFRVVWYNVENYFDCQDDSLTNDTEFLPGGLRGWNYTKYTQKQAHIAKVLATIGEWNTPTLVGLCEVESHQALDDLTRRSPLRTFDYDFIHHDSPDERGIDAALLYHRYSFFPIAHKAIPISFPNPQERPTRDILHVKGLTLSDDTLHIFLCHFPSRSGGALESEHRRLHAASVLRRQVDSVQTISPHTHILIMGDFNDYPDNRSLTHVLRAHPVPDSADSIRHNRLYNLTYTLYGQGRGTYKYNGEWGMLDQIIVSGTLLHPHTSLFIRPQDVRIADFPFLLTDDTHYLGQRPLRTYYGMKYEKGFSDHLPIYFNMWWREKK